MAAGTTADIHDLPIASRARTVRRVATPLRDPIAHRAAVSAEAVGRAVASVEAVDPAAVEEAVVSTAAVVAAVARAEAVAAAIRVAAATVAAGRNLMRKDGPDVPGAVPI